MLDKEAQTLKESRKLIAQKEARIPARWLPTLAQMMNDAIAHSSDDPFDYGIVSEIALWMFFYEPEFFDTTWGMTGCLEVPEARHIGILGEPDPNLDPEQQVRVDAIKARSGDYFRNVEAAYEKRERERAGGGREGD